VLVGAVAVLFPALLARSIEVSMTAAISIGATLGFMLPPSILRKAKNSTTASKSCRSNASVISFKVSM
jgi:hypothetical protein